MDRQFLNGAEVECVYDDDVDVIQRQKQNHGRGVQIGRVFNFVSSM